MTDSKNDPFQTGEVNDPVAAQSFGSQLRAAREKAGYSIERVAMSTRISQPFIEALENEQFHKLPGDMFGRGFLRNLCKAYGVPSEPMLAALELSLHTTHTRAEANSSNGRDDKRHHQLKKGVPFVQPNEWKKYMKGWAPHHYLQAKPLVTIAGVLVLALLLVNLWNRDSGSTEQPTLALEASAPVPSEAIAVPATVPVEAAAVVEPVKPTEALASGQMEVEIRVKEPTSITINKDQNKQVVEQLQVQTYRFSFEQQIKLYVEDPSRLEIFFKGQRVGANASKGEPKRFTFAAGPSEIAKKQEAPKL